MEEAFSAAIGGTQGSYDSLIGNNANQSIAGQKFAGTPNTGAPNTWYTNPGSGQMRFYGSDGNPALDIDTDHDHGFGVPHIHVWTPNPGGFPIRDGGGPMPGNF